MLDLLHRVRGHSLQMNQLSLQNMIGISCSKRYSVKIYIYFSILGYFYSWMKWGTWQTTTKRYSDLYFFLIWQCIWQYLTLVSHNPQRTGDSMRSPKLNIFSGYLRKFTFQHLVWIPENVDGSLIIQLDPLLLPIINVWRIKLINLSKEFTMVNKFIRRHYLRLRRLTTRAL